MGYEMEMGTKGGPPSSERRPSSAGGKAASAFSNIASGIPGLDGTGTKKDGNYSFLGDAP